MARKPDSDNPSQSPKGNSEPDFLEISSEDPVPLFCPVTHGLTWQRGESSEGERRRGTRFQRADIRMLFKPKGFFSRRTPLQSALLLDISAFGAAITTSRELRKKQKLKMYLQFQDGQVFTVSGRVKREILENQYQGYGIEFNSTELKFKDHLLRTALQKKFNRKRDRGKVKTRKRP